METASSATIGQLVPYWKQWATKNRDRINANMREYRKRRYEKNGKWLDEGPKARALKAWILKLKSGPCSDCNVYYPSCCMDFDHRLGEIKRYNVGSMVAHHYARELIEAEILKCDLVCANCHRVRTQQRRIGSGGNSRIRSIPKNTSSKSRDCNK